MFPAASAQFPVASLFNVSCSKYAGELQINMTLSMYAIEVTKNAVHLVENFSKDVAVAKFGQFGAGLR
jgi:hypothetical protein